MGLVEDVTGFTHLTSYESNRWYTISVTLDWANRQVDYYVDDKLIERRIPFRNPSVSSLTRLYLYNYEFTQSWWDGIELLTNNTPPAISIFPSNSAQFVNGVWSGYVTVQPAGTNVFLTVADGSGHSGMGNSFVLATFPDADGDGMPDDWELAHNLNPSSAADAGTDLDGDGVSNLQEYLAGTNPNDPADSLRIMSVALLSAGDVQLTFSTVASRYYRLERTENLESAVWTVANDLIAGTGGPLNVLEPGGAGQVKRFYRVRLLP